MSEEKKDTVDIEVAVVGAEEATEKLTQLAAAAKDAATMIIAAADALAIFHARMVAMEGFGDPEMIITGEDEVSEMIDAAMNRKTDG